MCDVRLNALVYRDLELVGKFAAYKPDLLYICRAHAPFTDVALDIMFIVVLLMYLRSPPDHSFSMRAKFAITFFT